MGTTVLHALSLLPGPLPGAPGFVLGGWEGVRVSLQRTQPPLRAPGSWLTVIRVHRRVKWPGGGGGDCHWTKQDSGRDGPVLWDKEAEGHMMGMNRTWQPRYGDMERPV